MKKRSWLLWLLLFVPALAWAEAPRMDTSITKEEGKLSRTTDINKDDKPDHWWYSLRDGTVLKIERDLDFDGTVDARQWTFLRDPATRKVEKIMYGDLATSKVTRIDYYDELGYLEKMEVSTKGFESVDLVINCHGQVMDEVQADLNGDGAADLVLTFDNGAFYKATATYKQVEGVNWQDMDAVGKWWKQNDPRQYPRYVDLLKRFKVK